MPNIEIASAQPVFNGVPDDSESRIVRTGGGSIYGFQCTGLTGQTATVQGSLDGTNWVDIISFEIESDSDVLPAQRQFVYSWLQVSGDATLVIVRSAA